MKRSIAVLIIGLAATEVMAGTTDNLLIIYAHLAGKTVLRPGSLPELPASLVSEVPTNKDSAVIFIEARLKESQWEVVRDGEKFVRILPVGWRNSPLAAPLDRLQPPPADDATVSKIPAGSSKIPAGIINFQNVSLDAVLDIYSKLRGRTILRPHFLPTSGFNLQTQTPLTRNEAIHVFDVTLVLNGVATIEDGEKLVQVVPLDQVPQVQARAPKAEPGATLIDPEQIQKSLADTNTPAMKSRTGKPAPNRAVSRTTAYRLVEYHAELSNRKAEPPKHFAQDPIIFEVRTPLTKPELLYAIATTLALNGRKIEPIDDDTITMESMSPARKPGNHSNAILNPPLN